MDIWLLVFALSVLLFFVYMFYRLIRSRKGSGAGTFMIMSGATDALMDTDKKRAAEVIVERNAKKKLDEQSASEPGIKQKKTK